MDSHRTPTDGEQPDAPSDAAETNVNAVPPCAGCGTNEPPTAEGLCPTPSCRKFRHGHSLSTIHEGRSRFSRADIDARDALIKRLFAERGGRVSLDVVSQLRVEDYATASIQLAKVTRRLETLGAVSEAGNKRRSLVDVYNTFSARVERLAADLPLPLMKRSSPDGKPGLEDLTLDDLLERTTIIREHLLTLRSGPAKPVEQPSSSPIVTVASSPTPATVEDSTPVEPSNCPYCDQSLATCNDMRQHDLPAWRSLHWSDPQEVQRRAEEATREMLHQAGKPLPDWYR